MNILIGDKMNFYLHGFYFSIYLWHRAIIKMSIKLNFGAVPDNSEKGLLWVLCARAV